MPNNVPLLGSAAPCRKRSNWSVLLEDENVTGGTYKRPLCHYGIPKFWEYPDDTIVQQDGAPPPFSGLKSQHLDQKYLNCYIGRWPDFVAPFLSGLDALWIPFLGILENFCMLGPSPHNLRAKN